MRKLDTVLISHADSDHIYGLSSLVESGSVKIGKVFVNPDLQKTSAAWANLILRLDNLNQRELLQLQPALTTRLNPELNLASAKIEVLWPTPGGALTGVGSKRHGETPHTSNSLSCVFRVSVDSGASVLLCGDVTESSFQKMSALPTGVAADIVVFPHHGGGGASGSDDAFARRVCSATKASTFLFSLGRSKHQNPRPDVIAAIREVSPEAWIACTQLSKHCCAGSIRTLPKPDYIDADPLALPQAPCSGTLTFDLTRTEGNPLPVRAEHRRFVKISVPNALCRGNQPLPAT